MFSPSGPLREAELVLFPCGAVSPQSHIHHHSPPPVHSGSPVHPCSPSVHSGSPVHHYSLPPVQSGSPVHHHSLPPVQSGSPVHHHSLPPVQSGSTVHHHPLPPVQSGSPTNISGMQKDMPFPVLLVGDVKSLSSRVDKKMLVAGAVNGKRWEPKDGGFHRLKFLEIFDCDLQHWKATSDHFPILECLTLRCRSLKEIPSDFVYITTLKSIKLYGDLYHLKSSAMHIQEEQQEYGNDAFVADKFGYSEADNSCIIA
nr:putative late blight resistance protein homolog R1A-4 isoform X2 [Ipomoea batatas]